MLKLLKLICIIQLALGISAPVPGQVIRHGDCVVDEEIWTIPQCALETRDGQVYLSKKYLSLFFPSGKTDMAAIQLDHRWAYINRQGRVVVQNVETFDNGPSPFHHGLVRATSEGKFGLVSSNGVIIVPFKYDGMYQYDPDRGWLACTGCHAVTGGEYHWFEGGEWYWLNQRGQVIGKAEDPKTLKQKGDN